VGKLRFSPDGKLLPVGAEAIEIWDSQQLRLLAEYPHATAAIAWAPTGRRLAAVVGGRLHLIDVELGTEAPA
jgi:hypothetical protein